MALITTLYTFGWYGVEGDTPCAEYSLKDNIGTYVKDQGNLTAPATYSGPFEEADAKLVTIIGYEGGASYSWNPGDEKAMFNRDGSPKPEKPAPDFNTLKCGRMYLIKNFRLLPINIPGFIPSASGVDMGRVKTA